MALTKKQRFIGFILIFILGLSLFLRLPACYFPDFEVKTREITVEDIQLTQDVLEEKGAISKFVLGLSMYPTIKPGMICSCIKTDDYETRDIISYYINENSPTFIAHRIVEVLPGDKYITKGDNNLHIDLWIVPKERVFCEFEEIPYLEYLLRGGLSG